MQDREERAASSLFSRTNILSLYLPAFALSIGTGIATPAIPVYAQSFGVDFAAASLVIILHNIGGVVATFPIGYAIDKIGRRPILLAGPILTAISSFLMVFAGSFPEVLVYRFIGGAAAQMWQESRLAVIADTGTDRQRGRQITWMLSMQRTGQLFAPAIGGLLATTLDIRAPFVVHGILSLIAVIPSFAMMKETAPPRRRRQGADSKDDEGGEWRRIFTEVMTVQMRIFLVAQFLANVARGQFRGGLLLLYAAYAYGANAAALGVLASTNAIAGIPIGFASGYIMDRYGRKKTIVPGFSLIFVTTLFMTFTALFHMPFEAFALSYFLVNAAQSLTGGNMQVLGSDLAPSYARGRFFAIWRMVGEGGGAVSPVLVATLSTVSYALAFGVLSFSALGVALLIGFGIRETVGRVRAPAAEAVSSGGPSG